VRRIIEAKDVNIYMIQSMNNEMTLWNWDIKTVNMFASTLL